LWLEHGRAIAIGETDTVLPQYLAAMTAREGPASALPSRVPMADSIPNVDHRHGDGRAEILGIAILNEFSEPVHLMLPQSRILVRVTFRANQDLARPAVGFLPPMARAAVSTVDFHLDVPEFYPCAFSFSPFVRDGVTCDWIDNAITVQMARGEGPVYGYIHTPCKVEFNPGVSSTALESSLA
jgi:hypothetical protein